jgi:hypothetical protein
MHKRDSTLKALNRPVYAAKAHCKDHFEINRGPSWRALPMMARSMLETEDEKKAGQLFEGSAAILRRSDSER